ncbi:hypothetical protein [Mucilaginibacter glaciei]|uniref:YtxH domain-containing protein n=1 Tax=Mucilaginibacter glaciei TaxID=2772109 RepID=A0A926S281_9SPHI|nr:hypothetical protein [Mucilaginibacter glaciei]MBD1393582.1 hypothetical protein [Mucilaginibacter glaciei]
MKNPFQKKDHTGLIATIAIGTLAAGALTYWFLSDSGQVSRKKAKKMLKDAAKNAAAEYGSKKVPFSKKSIKSVLDHVL